MKARRKEMSAYEATEVCLEKAKLNTEQTKAGLEDATVYTRIFEETLNKMDTTELETNRENSDAVTEWQDVPKEDVVVETI
jgi:hypothetical protein